MSISNTSKLGFKLNTKLKTVNDFHEAAKKMALSASSESNAYLKVQRIKASNHYWQEAVKRDSDLPLKIHLRKQMVQRPIQNFALFK